MPISTDKIYDPKFVTALFDEMSKTYGLVNTVSSFGFCIFWRRHCSNLIEFRNGDRIVDLMSGMAELSIHVCKRVEKPEQIFAIDLSPEMNRLARNSISRKKLSFCKVIKGDALATDIPSDSIDAVVSTFGLKTFSVQQLQQLAAEVKRILKPGGQIAFLEISVPKFWLLKLTYMFYLNRIIPIVGRILMGNPENYRLLGVYTTRFQNCDQAIQIFQNSGIAIEPKSFFFGCATGFSGRLLPVSSAHPDASK